MWSLYGKLRFLTPIYKRIHQVVSIGGKKRSHKETLLHFVEKDTSSGFSSTSCKEKCPHHLEECKLMPSMWWTYSLGTNSLRLKERHELTMLNEWPLVLWCCIKSKVKGQTAEKSFWFQAKIYKAGLMKH